MSDIPTVHSDPRELSGCTVESNKVRLKQVFDEIVIQATAAQTWQVLSQYGDVSEFQAGVRDSQKLPGNADKAGLGCEPACNIVDMGLHI